jgi:hypothetical protein
MRVVVVVVVRMVVAVLMGVTVLMGVVVTMVVTVLVTMLMGGLVVERAVRGARARRLLHRWIRVGNRQLPARSTRYPARLLFARGVTGSVKTRALETRLLAARAVVARPLGRTIALRRRTISPVATAARRRTISPVATATLRRSTPITASVARRRAVSPVAAACGRSTPITTSVARRRAVSPVAAAARRRPSAVSGRWPATGLRRRTGLGLCGPRTSLDHYVGGRQLVLLFHAGDPSGLLSRARL